MRSTHRTIGDSNMSISYKSLWVLLVIPVFWTFYHQHSISVTTLSPQGCRMSWMSPSYVVQDGFNKTWTPLARRYSLLLYREVGWDSEVPSGRPALFIPGNAGSSHQVRSIASSAARQIYDSPHVRSTNLPANVEPLDLYAVEFNEDLSALHGPTLQTQTAYVRSALEYIVSRYPQNPNLQVVLLGHSMGGIVALNVLESPYHNTLVGAIITMSSPHSLPPARLDRELERAFRTSLGVLWNTPKLGNSTYHAPAILAICGGATDNMIPMESCALPSPPAGVPLREDSLYRRTVFTSGLDGTWSGVGHREMVWCHQVRWRVARAALELAVAEPSHRGAILDRWFAGTPNQGTPHRTISPSSSPPTTVSTGRLVLKQLRSETTVYRLPITPARTRLVIMLTRGRIAGVSPEKEVLADVTVDFCESNQASSGGACKPVVPKAIRLIPNPPIHASFPLPGEGVDESDGVVVWEGEAPEAHGAFAVTVASTGDSGPWLTATLEPSDSAEVIVYQSSAIGPFFGATQINIPMSSSLVHNIWLPSLVSNAMIVYKAEFAHEGNCVDPLLAPLLVHTSSDAESHFHRTVSSSTDGVNLHTHNAGPFLDGKRGVNLTIYSSGECHVAKLQLRVNWPMSIGRMASRLWAGVFAWAVATIAAMNALAWYNWDGSQQFPSVQKSFEYTTRRFAGPALAGVSTLAILPLPTSFMLGLSGEPIFFVLAPITLLLAMASVGCTCFILSGLQWALGKLSQILMAFGLSADADTRRQAFARSSLVFYLTLAGLVLVFIPYQAVYLVAFMLHLWECSITRVHLKSLGVTKAGDRNVLSLHAQASHFLLMLFWLLPLVAPVLIVWARTLVNAGINTPFDGDHNILHIMFVVMCVELGGSRALGATSSLSRNLLASFYFVMGSVAIVLGARYTYFLYLCFSVCCAVFVIGTVGDRQVVRGVSH
ncbi:PGAP1-domain-containing protein [Ceratobasidium sp. AG-I]|nr:PGAP1-domain-containing protein [Ceratobasidium sp. AG-I]